MALGWLWGRNPLAINTLSGGFDVALGGFNVMRDFHASAAFRSCAGHLTYIMRSGGDRRRPWEYQSDLRGVSGACPGRLPRLSAASSNGLAHGTVASGPAPARRIVGRAAPWPREGSSVIGVAVGAGCPRTSARRQLKKSPETIEHLNWPHLLRQLARLKSGPLSPPQLLLGLDRICPLLPPTIPA